MDPMTHPDYIRNKAIQLRVEKKLTIDEIAERLSLSRTTIFYWVKDIEIPRKPARGFRTEAQILGTRSMQAKYTKAREDAYRQGMEEYEGLCLEPTFKEFLCMYLGEGYKKCRNTVSIANSDPMVVVLGDRWIRKLGKNKIRYAVQFHADQDLHELQEFWSQLLGVKPDQINLQRKSNSNQLNGRTWRSAHGVLTVSMGDTYLRARLQAWMDLLRAEWK